MTLVSLLLAAALSAGNAEFDATAASGAMDIAIARETSRLAAEGPARDSLKAKMLANPQDYDTTAKAKAQAKQDYLELAESELKAAQARAAEKLGIADAKSLKSVAVPNLDASFERRFAEERQAACAEQAKTIAANVKPSEADFGQKGEEMIRAELEAAVIGQQRAVVFEENRKYISEQIVGPILDSAKQELKRQREYLKRTRCDAYAPSALERELAANLERNVADRNAKDKSSAIKWGTFPVVVREGAREVAEKRTLDRVAHAIDDVEMKVDADLIRGKIAADKVQHRKASDSEKAFRNVFAGLLAGKALDKVIADAPEAERAEFKDFVMLRAGEASLGKAVEARVKRELVPEVRRIRGEIAAEDAQRLWPALMDGTWFPEPSLADAMCARSDYSKAVKHWRNSPELAGVVQASRGRSAHDDGRRSAESAPYPGRAAHDDGVAPVVIEETEKLADERVAKAFDLARNAINAQNAVLDKVAPEVLAEAKDRKASWFSRTPDFDKLVGMLTAGVEAQWGETRETVLWGGEEKPANAGEQHRELFPSVRRRIELMAKTILAEMEKPEPEEKPETPPEETPPEETPPEETPPEEEKPEELEFTISVKKSGDTLETKILKGRSPVFERSCPARKGDFRSASGALIDKLIEVLELK